YVSDQDLTNPSWTPPRKGYFRIDCGSGTLYDAAEEGTDPDDPSLPRTRRLPTAVGASTDLYPSMQFTVRLPGVRPDQFFTTQHTIGVNTPKNLNYWSQPISLVPEGLAA